MTALFRYENFDMTPELKKALTYSLVMHIIIFTLGIFGLPYLTKPPRLPQPIAVEIVNIGDITTTNKKPNQSQLKKAEDKPAPKIEKKVEAPPKVEANEPPKIKPLEKPIEKEKDTIKPPPKAPPLPAEKLEKPKEKPKPKEEQKEAVQQEEEFDSLLKNLQDSITPSEETAEDAKPVPQEKSPLAQFSERLSATEADAIASALNEQFRSCWNMLAGARNAENIVVKINLIVRPDRTVQSARVVEQWRYSQDGFYRAAADEAMRAINHPNCEVLDLPPDKYNLWKDLTFNFNPSGSL